MPNKVIVQTHHISYDPEITRNIYKGEHQIITLLQRRKNFSKGFVTALKCMLPLLEDVAVEVHKNLPTPKGRAVFKPDRRKPDARRGKKVCRGNGPAADAP